MILRSLFIVLAMLSAAAMAHFAKPTKRIADDRERIQLETMIPKQLETWHQDLSAELTLVNPQTQTVLDKIYEQTLTRVYVNDIGERVMVSIAYGGDQSDSMQVHKPEICYPAQGFTVERAWPDAIETTYGSLPIRRVTTNLGPRHEPLSYWVVIGDQAVRSGLPQKLAQLRYGLSGTIPDGLIVRVSTITRDEPAAFKQQDAFIKELLASLGQSERIRLMGAAAAVR